MRYAVAAMAIGVGCSALWAQGINEEPPQPSAGSQAEALSLPAGMLPQQEPDLSQPQPWTVGTGIGFAGFGFDDNGVENGGYFIPPDPSGAAGADRVVAVVNCMIEARDRTGALLWRDSLKDFFGPLSPATRTFDPKVIYDQYEDRFVVVTLEKVETGSNPNTGNTSYLYLAVSKDGFPGSATSTDWDYAAIDAKASIGGVDHWADYPGFAVDEEAVYITANMFAHSGAATDFQTRLWIIDKGVSSGFYAGGSIAYTAHVPWTEAGVSSHNTTQPAHVFGAGGVGPGIGTFLVRYSGYTYGELGGIESTLVLRVDDPLGAPTFTSQNVNVGDIEDVGGSLGWPDLVDAPQSGSAYGIEAGDRRALHAVWRDDMLWWTTTIAPNDGSADDGETTAHWFRFSTAAVPTGSVTLVDQGNLGGEDTASGAYTFFASVAVNGAGEAMFSYAASAPSIYAGAYAAGRQPGDPAGTVQPSVTVHAGTDAYVRTFGTAGVDRNRWGDYSGISVDPTDDSQFWVFNEFADTRGTAINSEDGRWGTAWARLSLEDTCWVAAAVHPERLSPADGPWTLSGPDAASLDGVVSHISGSIWGAYLLISKCAVADTSYDMTFTASNSGFSASEPGPRIGGMALRYQDASNIVGIQGSTGGSAVTYSPFVVVGGDHTVAAPTVIEQHAVPVAGVVDQTIGVRVEARGNTYHVYVDSVLALSFQDAGSHFLSSTDIGLMLYPSDYSLRHANQWSDLVVTQGPNTPPVLAAIGPQSATVGVAFSLALSASDADGDSLTFSMSGAPSGATLSGALFEWTPDSTQVGTHEVAFAVVDHRGGADSAAVTLTVSSTAAPFTIPLAVGFNLISLGTVSASDSIAAVAQGVLPNLLRVLGFETPLINPNAPTVGATLYDPSLPAFVSTLNTVDPRLGYWFVMSGSDTLAIGSGAAKPATPARPFDLPGFVDGHLHPVNDFMGIWGRIEIDGRPAGIGTVVEVIDGEGHLAGRARVVEAGFYGFLPIYRDRKETVVDEGAVTGEWLTVLVDGREADRLVQWSSFGDVQQLDLQVVAPVVPRATALHENYPNPFNPSTTILVDVADPGPVSVVIYDVTGRRVRQLVGGVLETGTHRLMWDGRDADGLLVGSGMYLCELRSRRVRELQKMVLMK